MSHASALVETVRFEWRYHTRQLSFVAGMVIFAFFGFVLTVGLGRSEINANSPALITEVMSLLSLVSVFPLTVFSAAAILRDREHGMEELVFATPVRKRSFLFARFSGVLLASVSLMLCATAGMLVAPLSGMVDPSRVGPTNPLHYAQAFAMFALPDVLLVASLVFAIAALTRSAPASYVGSVVIYVLYFVAAAFTNSPLMAASTSNAGSSMTLASLLDPIGLSAFFEQTRYWTASERNESMVSLSGNLLANRILWLLASLSIIALVERAYPFRLVSGSRGRSSRSSDDAPPRVGLPRVATTTGTIGQLLTSIRLEIRLLVVNLPFVVLLLAWVVFAFPEVWGPVTSGEYGSPFVPFTSLVLSRLWQPLSVLGTLAMIYWSAEAFWRERAVRIDPIVSATPVSGTLMFASKLAALASMSVLIALVGVAVGVAVQLIRGGAPVEPLPYLGFVVTGVIPLALFAAGCGVVHVASPNKYAGMFFTLVLAAFVHRGELIGIEHPLLRFAALPAIGHSDLSGFDGLTPFAWLTLYWTLVVATLTALAGRLWRRHDDESLLARAKSIFAEGRLTILALSVAAAMGIGAWVFVNVNVLNIYESTEETLDWKADYERQWGPRAADPQPAISAIETTVDIDPDRDSLRLRGTYRLTNTTDQRITRLLASVRRDATRSTLTVSGGTDAARDLRFGMHDFVLEEPLEPGASITMSFDVEYRRRGFSTEAPDIGVKSNGSFVMGFLSFPGVGYRTSYEIRDVDERTKRGLPERGHRSELGEDSADSAVASEWVSVDATVSTKKGQTVVGPGRLVRSWSEGDRALFHYRTDAPVPDVIAFTSARYSVTRAQHAGVDIEIYTHPEHERVVSAILETARASLDVFAAAYGDYPHPHLRIAEIPSSARFGGFATPGMILLAESRVFYVDTEREAPVDLVCRRVAHEIAHQWWGHHVVPASVDGGAMLTESLTKDAEMLVLERLRGREQVRNLRAVELDRYLSGRIGRTEEPLYRASDSHLVYSKGPLVLGAIRDLLGDDAVATALRALVDEESGPEGNATSLDLIEQLRRVAPEESKGLVDEWMREVVLYDLAIEGVETKRLPDGQVQLDVRARAEKLRVVDGRENAVAMNEEIGFAIYGNDGSLLASAKPVLVSGLNELSFVVTGEPAQVQVDPDIVRIDRNRLDNTWNVAVN